jgi:nucleoid-associated protein YgaU
VDRMAAQTVTIGGACGGRHGGGGVVAAVVGVPTVERWRGWTDEGRKRSMLAVGAGGRQQRGRRRAERLQVDPTTVTVGGPNGGDRWTE